MKFSSFEPIFHPMHKIFLFNSARFGQFSKNLWAENVIPVSNLSRLGDWGGGAKSLRRLKFSKKFRWNLMNVWNLFCLEKRTLYDSLIFGRIWNLINKWKLLRWSKNDISCYIIKANKEIINVSNKLRPGMFLELRAK